MPTTSSNKSITRKSIMKKSKRNSSNKTKRVTIHSPKNEMRLYDLDSAEINAKYTPKHLKMEKCGKGIYPCSLRDVIFENEEEWNDYLESLRTRNVTTGHKSVSSHRRSIMRSLALQGKTSRRIPEEWRLYNVKTGEIIDMRSLGPKSLVYKSLK